jgi:DNA polymerase-3 subunit epsilon
MRQIVLDTETTGIDPREHRIIEIGCVELVDRKLTGNHYHVYINPEREVEAEAIQVHGITNEFLADKPLFNQVADEFYRFIEGAELVIHNAPFDVGFINMEFQRLGNPVGQVSEYCSVLDTLVMAREKHPGQKNNLDALCKRYFVDNSQRDLHGALLDAEILALVYLAMTGGQTSLILSDEPATGSSGGRQTEGLAARRPIDGNDLPLVNISQEELDAHRAFLDLIESKGSSPLWNQYDS